MKRAYHIVVVVSLAAAMNLQAQPKEFTNSVGMKFVWIPPGSFLMGSPQTENGREQHEIQHRVTLTKGFYMGVYPVTQVQWLAVMGNNLSQFKGDTNLPVERVSWDDCQVFMRKMGAKEGHAYRLPTEAEWEYACRAGSTGPYCFGDQGLLDQYAWYRENSEDKTHPVGRKRANLWGLCDMHGNVLQWCADWYGDYPQGALVDPKGPSTDLSRVSEFILQLSSPKFTERQAATKALSEIGWPALQALRKAATIAPDLETQRRALQIVATIPKYTGYRVLCSAFYDPPSSVRAAYRAKSLPEDAYYSYGVRAVKPE